MKIENRIESGGLKGAEDNTDIRVDSGVGARAGNRRRVGALVEKSPGAVSPSWACLSRPTSPELRPESADRNVGVTNVGVRSKQVQNTDGFWELSFAGQRAVLPQHQGLFYVAFLLANPHGAPIPAVDLAVEVFERYGEHDDFRPPIPEYLRDHSRVAKILLRKEKRLEAVVDREGEEEFVRLEALRELMVLDELKRIYFSEVAREAKDARRVVSEALRELHAMLASAVDIRGEPHWLIRDFATHVLHYVLMPSERVSAREGVALFVYRPAGEGN